MQICKTIVCCKIDLFTGILAFRKDLAYLIQVQRHLYRFQKIDVFFLSFLDLNGLSKAVLNPWISEKGITGGSLHWNNLEKRCYKVR